LSAAGEGKGHTLNPQKAPLLVERGLALNDGFVVAYYRGSFAICGYDKPSYRTMLLQLPSESGRNKKEWQSSPFTDAGI